MVYCIYNSRNYYRLLNNHKCACTILRSTTVEITIGYLTYTDKLEQFSSTTVEITIGYLTMTNRAKWALSTTVEITIGYLTKYEYKGSAYIYNSRNYYRLLNIPTMI